MSNSGRPKHKSAEDTRTEILNAAMKIFAERGFFKTTLREIADSAGVTHGMIRYYFKTKDNLWEAVINHGFEYHMDSLNDFFNSTENSDSVEFFKLFVKKCIQLTVELPEFVSFIHQYSQKGIPHLELVLEKLNIIGEKIEPVFQDLKQQGYFPKFDTFSHRIYVRALIETPLLVPELNSAIVGIELTSEEGINKHTEWVLDFIFS